MILIRRYMATWQSDLAMHEIQSQFCFGEVEDIVAPPDNYRFKASDGRQGPAIDRLNVALEEVLKEDAAGAGIQLNNVGRVSRGKYAQRLGIDPTYICKACIETLDKWDAVLKQKNDGLNSTARAFIELVRTDSASDVGVAARGAKISLKNYAERLGVTSRAVAKAMGAALALLEAELREAGSLTIKSVKQSPRQPSESGAEQAARLRTLIEHDDNSDSGIRLTNRGKVNQSHYATILGIPGKIFSSASKQLLAAYDAQAVLRNNGLNPQTANFLRLVEADKTDLGHVVGTRYQLVDLPYYAAKLGISAPGLRLALGDQHPIISKRLLEQGCLRTPAESLLLEEVDRDFAEGRLRFGRGGRLHRQHYAKRIGAENGVMGRAALLFMDELDRKYGASSNAEVHLDDMRQWMEDHYQRRALPVRDSKIDRVLFQQAFKLKGGTFLVRYPAIRALFDEFDARVIADGYCSSALDTELQRLRGALADAPKLNKDRLRISRPDLALKLGIPVGRLWNKTFIDEIRLVEEKILYQAQRCLIDPYIAGRIFFFSDLSHLWGGGFLTTLGAQFKKAFGHTREAELLKAQYLALYNLLSWIGKSDAAICRAVVLSAIDGKPLDPNEWELAVFAFREQLINDIKQGLQSKPRVDSKISALRRALAALDPVLPSITTDLPGIKHARAFTAHRGSLAEATSEGATAKSYIDFANSMLRQAADRYKVDISPIEAANFTSVLATEMERAGDLPTDIGHAILTVLDRRLNSLSDAAAQIMDQARASLIEGKLLLGQADINASLFYQNYKGGGAMTSAGRALLREWFPNPVGLPAKKAEAVRRRSLANLLAMAVTEFDGFLPGMTNKKTSENLGQFFQKRYLELGQKEALGPLLNPSRDTTGAALTLYLIESGANVSVGRTLDFDCIEPGSQPGFKLVTGHKARAKGKPIYSELPSNSQAIQALEWYADHSVRFRSKAIEMESSSLFLHQVVEQPQLATSHWYTNWFKSFANGIAGLAQAAVTPSMIRPSVLLKAALENDGRLQVGRAIGQHGEAVSRGYQEKLPVRLLRDQHMRRFQRHYETRVLQKVVDVARSLGISAEEFEQRVSELQATGLGTFCADPRARPGFEGQRCQTIDCWRDCPQLLIVANVEAIALLQLWQSSLEDARGDWERDHPERWGEVWLPWLCLTEVVEKRMSRGALLLTWKQAQKKAAELVAQPGFVPPKPF